MSNGDNVVLLAPPGVGKTHLGVALGREAVARGYSVQFTTAMELLGSLLKAQQQGMPEGLLVGELAVVTQEADQLPIKPGLGLTGEWQGFATPNPHGSPPV